MKVFILLLALFVITACNNNNGAGSVMKKVKSRGVLNCGVSTGIIGFSNKGKDDQWKGLDVDICKAIATAIFGDASKVNYIPLNALERFDALSSGKIDILARNTTYTISRELKNNFNFGPVVFFDGQGFLMHKKLVVEDLNDFDGKTICTQTGTDANSILNDYLTARGIKYENKQFDNYQVMVLGLGTSKCDLASADVSSLAATRAELDARDEFVFHRLSISNEPLAPVVVKGDDDWYNVVKWSVYALIAAEELLIDSQNVDEMLTSKSMPVQKLLGSSGNIGELLGLDKKWAYNIIKQVGNYGQIWDRHLGKDSKVRLFRGYNRIWASGGLMYAPPIR